MDFPGVVKHVKLESNTILAALVAFGLILGLGYLVQARRWHVGEGSKMRRKQLFLMSDAEERASGLRERYRSSELSFPYNSSSL